MPIDIYEIDAINTLLNANQIVIAAGGGGIPVLDQRTTLKGASAIIEKDYTAAKLADMVDASTLLILSSSDNVVINKGTEKEKILCELSISEAKKLIESGELDSITTLPKIQASCNFVVAKKDRVAVITNLSKAKEGIALKAGTIIK